MLNPARWFRFIQFLLGLIVLVSSVASGRLVFGPIDPEAALNRLVAEVNGIAALTGDGGPSEIEDEPLEEISDEPIGGIIDEAAPPAAPLVPDQGAQPGGALGGGVSSGPDGGVEPPAQAPTPGETPPTPTSAPQPAPNTAPTRTPQVSQPTATNPAVPPPTATATASATPTTIPSVTRLDDPALRFLPEILAASSSTGVPPEVLAGVVRVESNGDPNLIAAGRGRGLTGVSEAALRAQGVGEGAWHDPAANILAGARELSARFAASGSWETALEQYFGTGCDSTGVCPEDYRYAVLAWASFYSGAIANPAGGGSTVLPPSWTPPSVAPYLGSSPRPVPFPPGVTPPAPTPALAATATSTATATGTPTPLPTENPVPTAIPTETPTPMAVPTETPSPVPTSTATATA